MLEDLTPPVRHYNCKVRSVMLGLDAKDVKVFENAIMSADVWPSKTLSNELKKRGLLLSDSAITSHRKKSCACFRLN
jgi:hypothetical protein